MVFLDGLDDCPRNVGRDAQGLKREKRQAKFMQVLEGPLYHYLKREAKRRGISTQELIRAVVIPQWQSWEALRSATLKRWVAGIGAPRVVLGRPKGNKGNSRAVLHATAPQNVIKTDAAS